MPDLDDLDEAASQPASASQDGRSATAHPLKDRVELQKFKAANATTAGSTWSGLGKHRGIAPGPQQ